jgi:RNA polymerase sigma factor (TIGR02999 family)
MTASPKDVTQLLADWSHGDREALDKLMPLVYDELRRVASHYLRRERPGHTLQTTALVHEAYLRLVDQKDVRWENRAHFFSIAAEAMRRILVEHARSHHAAKRGGGGPKLSLDEAVDWPEERAVDLVALDDALTSLTAIDPQKSRIVELRFFGGLTMEEVAQLLGVSLATVERGWRIAKLWLRREITGAVIRDA